MTHRRGRNYLLLSTCLLFGTWTGCATWLPSGEQPPAPTVGFKTPGLSNESVAIESILLRLNPDQASRLEELWNTTDQQILAMDRRLDLDKNGIRVGKVTGNLPHLLESWVLETEKRLEEDPLEQTGLAADAVSISTQWRCRANQIKDIPIRNLEQSNVTLFYHDETLKGRNLASPNFFYSMNAIPGDNFTAKIRLIPEVAYGDYKSRVVAREAALRPVSERESLHFAPLAVALQLQRGECLVLGPTSDRRGLGAEFFHSRTQDGLYEPLLLLVRLSASGVDSNFAPQDAAKVRKTLENL